MPQAIHVEPSITFLTDGGQPETLVLNRLVAFLDGATQSLDVAIYDAHLTEPFATQLTDAFDRARSRSVTIRAVYNEIDQLAFGGDGEPIPGSSPIVPRASKASPQTGPSLLKRITEAIAHKPINGVPDLMHHKYVIRDKQTVWTGSANWTDDSWTRQENALIVIDSADLAVAFQSDFDQLWTSGQVENSGRLDDQPALLTYKGAPFSVRAMFSPGRGRAISETIAAHITAAKERIVICSPVITSAEVLESLAKRLDDNDLANPMVITVDGPQMDGAINQWRHNHQSSWKVPLANHVLNGAQAARKPSTPYAPGTMHDYMHAKMVICDDAVITGSFNCSHSGEMNAENVLEIINGPFADECAAFARSVNVRYKSLPQQHAGAALR